MMADKKIDFKVQNPFTFLIFLIVLAVFAPAATIWALNTLFPALAIPMNFWTWLAVFWLTAVLIRVKGS